MAEEILVKEPLTPAMIEPGKELIKRLDAKGFDLICAFWLYYPDSGQWRLVLASPKVDAEGPSRAYAMIQDVMDDNFAAAGFVLSGIKLLGAQDRVVKSLRSVLKTEPKFISGIRFTRNRINDVFIEDAYVYRVA